MRGYHRILVVCALVLAGGAMAARAGDADHEPGAGGGDDGAPYFGDAKDVAGLKPLASVRVKAAVQGTLRFLIGQTDDEGKFKLNGLGADVDANTVVVTCEKAGYRLIDAARRRLGPGADAPVEVECLMEKQ